MKFAILFKILITISEAKSDSLLTGTYDPNSTLRDVREIDVLRQLVNQETLIRVSVVNDVRAAVNDVSSVKRNLEVTETTVTTLLQTIATLKREVAALRQDDTLSQKIEKLKREIDTLKQNNSLQQTVEALKREIDTLKQNNSLQQTVEALKMEIDTLKQNNSLQQTVETLKREIDTLKQNNTLQQTVETLKRDIDTLKQNNTLQQTVETLKRDIDTLKQNNTLQQTVEAPKKEIDTLKQNNTLQQTVEAPKREIDTLKQNNTLQQTVEAIKSDIDTLRQNNTLQQTHIQQSLTRSEGKTMETDLKLTRDCRAHYLLGHRQSGVYNINPFGNETSVSVYCDMVTEGGGWTAVQKRVSGSVSFDRMWSDYKTGFGNPNDSYWIGNDVIHQLTKGRNSSLYLSITLTNGTKLYELYNQFSVGEEINKYRLFLGGPATGTLGDRMLDTRYPKDYNLSGMFFSTPDRDNDGWSSGNCAADCNLRGGWWFNYCHYAFLNGQWSPGPWYRPWYRTVTDSKQIKETSMMIKPH